MLRIKLSLVLGLSLALAGCSGDDPTPPEAPPESTPEPVVEATPEPTAAANDDDSAGSDAAAAEAGEADAAVADGEAPADPVEEVVPEPPATTDDPGEPQTGKHDDPPPPPPPGSTDPPFDISVANVERSKDNTSADIGIAVRSSPEIANAVKWSAPAGLTGPKKTVGKEDTIYTWTVKGLTLGASKGTIKGTYESWTLKADYEIGAVEVAPPPPPAPPEEE